MYKITSVQSTLISIGVKFLSFASLNPLTSGSNSAFMLFVSKTLPAKLTFQFPSLSLMTPPIPPFLLFTR